MGSASFTFRAAGSAFHLTQAGANNAGGQPIPRKGVLALANPAIVDGNHFCEATLERARGTLKSVATSSPV